MHGFKAPMGPIRKTRLEEEVEPITTVEEFRLHAGETVADLVAPEVDEIRVIAMNAAKVADRNRDRDDGAAFIHRRLIEIASELTDFQVLLAERSAR